MADHTLSTFGDGGFSGRCPTWDGQASSYRKFKHDVEWFLHGEDLTKIWFVIAIRIINKQTGAVKRRAQELDPATLGGISPVLYTDVTAKAHNDLGGTQVATGDVEVDGDPLAGVVRVMDVWRDLAGLDPAHNKADLRDTFYKNLQRRTGEAVTEWSVRFREHVSAMTEAGIIVDDGEQAYVYRERLSLDARRLENLDTACGPDPDYKTLETHALRLFRTLHVGEREQKRFHPSGTGSSVASSSLRSIGSRSWTSRGSPSSQSTSSWKKHPRQVHFTGNEDAHAEEDDQPAHGYKKHRLKKLSHPELASHGLRHMKSKMTRTCLKS